jgi:FHS family glucose/mannose:H+ symporter-like MFS transporter
MAHSTYSPRFIFFTLGMTYIATGIVSTLPSASLIRLASNTHVSLQVAGGIFTVSAFGFLLGAILAGTLTRFMKPKYLLAFGLFLLASGSLATALTDSFPVLLISQGFKGLGFGFIDIALNTIATIAFRETLSEKLNNIHGMYGVGALLGPLLLAFGLQFFNSLPFAYLFGMLVSVLTIILILTQYIPDLPRVAKSEQSDKTASRRELRAVLRQGLLWSMALQISIYACAEVGFGNWLVTAVSESAHISLALAAPVATAFFIGLTAGRLGGAQLLKRGWLTETRLLYTALLGGALRGTLVAIFPAQPLISYGASALVGCFYGPLFPSLMAITSRRFVHSIGPVSSVMMIGTGATSMVIPAAMGLLIPVIGINWVMAIPAACCLLVIVPMALTNRSQRATPESSSPAQTTLRAEETAQA